MGRSVTDRQTVKIYQCSLSRLTRQQRSWETLSNTRQRQWNTFSFACALFKHTRYLSGRLFSRETWCKFKGQWWSYITAGLVFWAMPIFLDLAAFIPTIIWRPSQTQFLQRFTITKTRLRPISKTPIKPTVNFAVLLLLETKIALCS